MLTYEERFHFLVGNGTSLGVGFGGQQSSHLKTSFSSRSANELEDFFVGLKGFPVPVITDGAEETVLNRIPF